MKLIFKKNKEQLINVYNYINGEQKDFSYIEMIKELINSKKMDEPEISEELNDEEIKSIKSMVSYINNELSNIKE